MVYQALSDEQWEQIAFYLPACGHIGRPPQDDRACLEAILYILSTGCRWCELPRSFLPKSTVHRRFKVWAKCNFFKQVFRVLSRSLPESELYHLDSTLKAAKKGAILSPARVRSKEVKSA